MTGLAMDAATWSAIAGWAAAAVAIVAAVLAGRQAKAAREQADAATDQAASAWRGANAAEEQAVEARNANRLTEQQLELQRLSDRAAREPRFTLEWTDEPTMGDQTGWQSFTLRYNHGPDMLNDVKIIPLSDKVDWLRADEPWSAWGTNGEPRALSHPGLIRGMNWQIECRLTEDVDQIALGISSRSGEEAWTVTVTSSSRW
jgi:hypothetical protein